MEFKRLLLFATFIFAVTFYQGHCLQCYDCESSYSWDNCESNQKLQNCTDYPNLIEVCQKRLRIVELKDGTTEYCYWKASFVQTYCNKAFCQKPIDDTETKKLKAISCPIVECKTESDQRDMAAATESDQRDMTAATESDQRDMTAATESERDMTTPQQNLNET